MFVAFIYPNNLYAQAVSGTLNGHDYVDLGLSVKWATCNVGASSPEEYGDYYAWGETSTKSSYTSDNCQTWEMSIGDIKGTSRDVAHVKWGGSWHMPSEAELNDLLDADNCDWTWTTMNGVNGYKVTSRNTDYAGNYIFLPAADWHGPSPISHGQYGAYLGSTPDEDDAQICVVLIFGSGGHDTIWNYRFLGRTVRPVTE